MLNIACSQSAGSSYSTNTKFLLLPSRVVGGMSIDLISPKGIKY
jgi:hypothetical protein